MQFISPRVLDYTTARKIKFGQWIVEESRKIESESQQYITVFSLLIPTRMRAGLVDSIWNKETCEFFAQIEADIITSQSQHLKLAIPGIIGVAGLAGASVFGAIFLAGMISTTLATGGGVLFGLLALGGLGYCHVNVSVS